MLNTYFLYSGDRGVEVTTGIALRTRIREIYAIDKLQGMSKTDEFTKALQKAGKQKVDSVVALVRIRSTPSNVCRRERHAFLAGSARA